MSYSRVDKDNSLTVGEVVVEWSSESILRSNIFETGEQRVQFFWHVKSRNFPLNLYTNMSLNNLEKQNTHNKQKQLLLNLIFKLQFLQLGPKETKSCFKYCRELV